MSDLTMSEVLKDPLIRQLLRADKVTLGEFAALLERAAAQRARGFAERTITPDPSGGASELRIN